MPPIPKIHCNVMSLGKSSGAAELAVIGSELSTNAAVNVCPPSHIPIHATSLVLSDQRSVCSWAPAVFPLPCQCGKVIQAYATVGMTHCWKTDVNDTLITMKCQKVKMAVGKRVNTPWG